MPTWTFSFLLFRFAVWRIFWHLFITWNQDAKSHKSFKSILGQFNKNSSLLQASLRYLNVFDVLYDIVCIAFCVSLDLCVTINPPTFWGEFGSTVLSNMQRFESSTCSYCAFDTPGREETWKSHRNELEAYTYIYIARQFHGGKVTAFSCLFCRKSWKIPQISWKRPLFCFFVHVHTWRWFIVDLLSTFGFASFCHFSHRPNHSNLILHCSTSPRKQA